MDILCTAGCAGQGLKEAVQGTGSTNGKGCAICQADGFFSLAVLPGKLKAVQLMAPCFERMLCPGTGIRLCFCLVSVWSCAGGGLIVSQAQTEKGCGRHKLSAREDAGTGSVAG